MASQETAGWLAGLCEGRWRSNERQSYDVPSAACAFVSAREELLALGLVWREDGGGRLLSLLIPELLDESIQVVVDRTLEGAMGSIGRHALATS